MNLRAAASVVLTGLGLHRLARRGVLGAILMLHRVRPDGDRRWVADPGLWVTDGQLATLIHVLRREGYALVSLDDALARLSAPNGQPFACLTFDDGFRDFHDIALPLLAAEQVPATLYATSGFIDRTAPLWEAGLEALVARGGRIIADWGEGRQEYDLGDDAARSVAYASLCQALRRLAPLARTAVLDEMAACHAIDFLAVTDQVVLDWTMMETLAASPWVTIGGHTRTHPALALLPAAAAAEEMTAGRDRLEQRLGITVRHFAYPYGDVAAVTADTVTVAAVLGFASAALAYGGPLRHGEALCALPRIGFGGQDGPAALLARMAGLGRAATPHHRAVLAQGTT